MAYVPVGGQQRKKSEDTRRIQAVLDWIGEWTKKWLHRTATSSSATQY